MDLKELITALGVLADPNASSEDKAAALDKLTAYFDAQLSAQETQSAEAASSCSEAEAASATTESQSTEAASAAGDEEDKSKEMASALSSALEQIKALTSRIAKMEKASTVGSAPRAKVPTVIPRKEAPVQKDHVISMIEAAERNTIRNLSK